MVEEEKPPLSPSEKRQQQKKIYKLEKVSFSLTHQALEEDRGWRKEKKRKKQMESKNENINNININKDVRPYASSRPYHQP